MAIKRINKKELENSLWDKKSEISEMYFSCYKQQQGFQFWIYLNLETLELKESSMLTMSTSPNPINWYPNDNTVIVDVIHTDAIDHLDNEATEYYNENPDEYLDETFDDLIKKVIDSLTDESIEVLDERAWESRRIIKFFKNILINIAEQTSEKVEGTIDAKEIYDICWSEHEPDFSEMLYNSIIENLDIDEEKVSNFRWEGNSLSKIIDFDIEIEVK